MWLAQLREGFSASPVAPGIASVFETEHRGAGYDRIAALYDAVIGNALYNRIVWGIRKAAYERHALDALAGARAGGEAVLDCGCGSLVFTAGAYRQAAPEKLLLFDRSLAMLERARRRLDRPALQGDALNLPFTDHSFDRSFAWGMGHLFGSSSPLFAELARVTKPGGLVACSMIARTGRRIGDAMLGQLVRSGEAAASETAETWRSAFATHFRPDHEALHGNMLFLFGRA